MAHSKKIVKQVPGFSRYYINEYGDYILDTVNDIKIKPHLYDGCEYITVKVITDDGIALDYPVHRLVALAFVPKPDKCNIVHHIDGNKTNNHWSNLLWVNNEVHMWIHQGLKLQNCVIKKINK